MLIWMMFRLLCCLCCCVCFGCVSDCVLVARTVCKRRCFTFTRRERGCPLELSALVAWVIPFKDRGNGTGTPPARDSTGVAPYRCSVVVLVMVCWGVCGLSFPPGLYFFHHKSGAYFYSSTPQIYNVLLMREQNWATITCLLGVYSSGTSHGVSNPPPDLLAGCIEQGRTSMYQRVETSVYMVCMWAQIMDCHKGFCVSYAIFVDF